MNKSQWQKKQAANTLKPARDECLVLTLNYVCYRKRKLNQMIDIQTKHTVRNTNICAPTEPVTGTEMLKSSIKPHKWEHIPLLFADQSISRQQTPVNRNTIQNVCLQMRHRPLKKKNTHKLQQNTWNSLTRYSGERGGERKSFCFGQKYTTTACVSCCYERAVIPLTGRGCGAPPCVKPEPFRRAHCGQVCDASDRY